MSVDSVKVEEKKMLDAIYSGIDSSLNIEWRLMQPHEWGYRDIVTGEFILDDDPVKAANEIVRLKALLKLAMEDRLDTKDLKVEGCSSCDASIAFSECESSPRVCGHHCNHVWIHDECCWCGEVIEGTDEEG